MREASTAGTVDRIVQSKINKSGVCLMVVVVIVTCVINFHLFTLELALDSLSVRSVSDQWQNGADAFNKLHTSVSHRNDTNGKKTHQHSLTGLRIIQGRLSMVSYSIE